jgi:hypothetical protein
MANVVFNRSKGRVTEFAERVNGNDPTNAAFIIDVLATAGIESDATLIDLDTFAAVVAGTTNFVTQPSIRKTLDQTGGITITYNDTDDRTEVDIPDQTWTAVGAGDGFNDVITGYDSDTTGGNDTNILPMTLHDFVIVPDGSDITAQTPNGIFRAT